MSKINRNTPKGAILPLALVFERLTDEEEEQSLFRQLGLADMPTAGSSLWDRPVELVWPKGQHQWECSDAAWWAEGGEE